MKTIELVCHVYSELIPDFARLFTAQLSSLLLWPPQSCKVRVTVCTTPSDQLTLFVAREFDNRFNDERAPVEVISRMYRKSELFRRSIGRNDAAKQSKADVVWFADADYLLGEGCLDALASISNSFSPARVAFPREVKIHRSHQCGDEEIAKIVPGEPFTPDLSLFVPHRVKVAIGGLQIVSGEVARARGYCDGTKWVQPVDEAGGFRDTAEDKVYRGIIGGSEAIDLPGVLRCRHSKSAFESAEKRLAQTGGST